MSEFFPEGLKNNACYVGEKDSSYREEIIEFLEEKGFGMDPDEFRGRAAIIAGVLPITIDFAKKAYRMMGNVMSAAAAASSESLRTREEFYKLWE